jgi:hypothetical protein
VLDWLIPHETIEPRVGNEVRLDLTLAAQFERYRHLGSRIVELSQPLFYRLHLPQYCVN